ncbi:uncharacterized protein ARMOST_01528 [Armillaria ostoyae]|uniref:Uncharacterized protein n=1 Tax=Armillaria ostoyae TaxID=47428 RepID=A0A284QP81_ARMOS|nr:uncharacterized protein ARMOST_01528 [Armillaria ostoyae]
MADHHNAAVVMRKMFEVEVEKRE